MEKYEVLGQLFRVAEELRKDKQGKDESDGFSIQAKLSSSAKGLLCLLLKEKNVNQRTIAKTLNISSQAVSESVKKLEAKGLVTKSSGTINNENFIVLTTLGRESAQELVQKIKSHAETVFRDYTTEEVDRLYTLLDKILI